MIEDATASVVSRERAVRAETAAVLGRGVIEIGEARFSAYLAGATVLVTGAGGSLGADLCRRLPALGAKRIVLVDQSEGALVELERILRYDVGFSDAVPVLADLRSAARLRNVLAVHQPDVVFHTAAYKQVPLLETHPLEAIANNVLATRTLVTAVFAAEARRFVLYSTDKAVLPLSVLGQTKALAECIVGTAQLGQDSSRFACIRLGNVIDSSGSMLPLFRRQAAGGRALTVTDPDMTRYMMTVREATGLAVVAGALTEGADVFWLDMGSPVRVLEAAQAFIRVTANGNGSTPRIELVGARPGEKLHEELSEPGEEVFRTLHDRVFRSTVRRVNPDWLSDRLDGLAELVADANGPAARAELGDLHDAVRHNTIAGDVAPVR